MSVKRNTKQRRHLILQALLSKGEVAVDALAEAHDTSEVTIRKDLAMLEDAGLLLRRYGGAIALPNELLVTEDPQYTNPKKQIAQAAKALIRDHYRIIIDSGRTTTELIPYLSEFQGLVVMTNSLLVAEQLRALENEPTLLMTGGTWDKRSESFQGQQAQRMLREYNFDQLFIGADGLDPARGTCTYNEFTALSRAMAEVSREVIVLAESSKIDRKIPNLELPWKDVTSLVTDGELDEQNKSLIADQGVDILGVNI